MQQVSVFFSSRVFYFSSFLGLLLHEVGHCVQSLVGKLGPNSRKSPKTLRRMRIGLDVLKEVRIY